MSDTETLNEVNTDATRSMRAKVGAFLQQQGALVMLIVVCIAGFARYEAFLTPENLLNVVRQNSMLGLVALGMTFVILTRGIDLSVGALLAVAGVVAANLANQGLMIALVAAVATTTFLGLINGLVIAKARIQPFIVTLAMMIAARGLALTATGETSVGITDESFAWLGRHHQCGPGCGNPPPRQRRAFGIGQNRCRPLFQRLRHEPRTMGG